LTLHRVRYILTSDDRFLQKPRIEALLDKDDPSAIRPDWISKVRVILSRMDASIKPEAMDLPGFGFHKLTGSLPADTPYGSHETGALRSHGPAKTQSM
jgi:hypothetical protein